MIGKILEENNDLITPEILKNTIDSILMYNNSACFAHSETCTYLSLLLASKQNLDIEKTKQLYLASVFMNIGNYDSKVKDKIENADDRYFVTSQVSSIFVDRIGHLKKASKIIKNHHDRCDKNLKDESYYLGQKLHIASKIDVLQKEGKNIDEIKAYLIDNAGKLYEKQDVKDILPILDEKLLENIKNGECKKYIDKYISTINFKPMEKIMLLKLAITNFDITNISTSLHSQSAALFACFIGYYYGQNENDIYKLLIAGLLHDVGKEKIPQEIIDKPGKLTAEEFEIIKKHAFYTNQILKDCMPQDIVDIASRHHEKLDGSGYYMGYTAKDLNKNERIMTIADIVSALYAKRSYKDVFEHGEVVNELNKLVDGNKLDKNIVECFKKHQFQIYSKVYSLLEVEKLENDKVIQDVCKCVNKSIRNEEHKNFTFETK